MQPFLSESKGPPHTEERPKPALDCESKTTGHLTLPILSVSQLCCPSWPRTNASGHDESRPASAVSGAVRKLSPPSCFPACLVIPGPGGGAPEDPYRSPLAVYFFLLVAGFKPKTLHQRVDLGIVISISELEGQLWLLTGLVGLARNRDRYAGFFPPHTYPQLTVPFTLREEKK